MATRFYLPASGTAPLGSLAVDASWTRSDNLDRRPCGTTKSNTTITQKSATWQTTSNASWVWVQYQSKRLAAGYSWTTADTVSMVVKVAEAAAQVDSHLAYCIRVVSGDGSTVRGTIGTFRTSSSEYPTSLGAIATRIHSARTDGASNFSSQAGDRIIIEIGHYGVTPTANVVYQNLGDPSATSDYALTAALTTDLCPWVELSRTVSFDLRSNKGAYLKGTDTAKSNKAAYLNGASPTTPASSRKSAYLYGQVAVLDNNSAYLKGSASAIASKHAYCSGGVVVTDSSAAYTKGLSSDKSNKHAYLEGAAVDPAVTYIAFEIPYSTGDFIRSSQDAYLEGFVEALQASSRSYAYTNGQDNALSNKHAYLSGSSDVRDSRSAYLKGQSTEKSAVHSYLAGSQQGISRIWAFTRGQSVASYSTLAYLKGSSYAIDSTPAFLKGQSSQLASIHGYLKGSAATSSVIHAYLAGSVNIASKTLAFLQGSAHTTSYTHAYLKGEDHARSNKTAYTNGLLGQSSSIPAYLIGESTGSSVVHAFIYGSIYGTVCWGHSTNVVENNTRTLSGDWTGTGSISGSGDAEVATIASGEYINSAVVRTEERLISLRINVYDAGDDAIIKYRTGNTPASCEAASWSTYSAPFMSSGYVQVRLEVA